MAACTVYHADASASTPLTSRLEQTLTILTNLTAQRGYCFATNGALVEMRGKHEATIVRHIYALERLGYVLVKFVMGERRIFVLRTVEDSRDQGKQEARKMRKKCVPPAKPHSTRRSTQSETTNTPAPPSAPIPAEAEKSSVVVPPMQASETPTPIVEKLHRIGYSLSTARTLAEKYGERCLLAIKAYKEAVGVQKPLGWIRHAIEDPEFDFRPKKGVDQCPHRIIKAPAEPPTVASGGVEDVRNIVERIRARMRRVESG